MRPSKWGKVLVHSISEILLPSSQLSSLDVSRVTFQTGYRQLEYSVTPFKLPEALECFQTLKNDCLRSYLDKFVFFF